MITKLEPNQIFVFGSNTTGRHGRGAALQAKNEFGAIYGVGEGITGQCYAFPTLDENLKQRTIEELYLSRHKLYETCMANPDKEFLLTRVGTGLAGYDDSTMCFIFLGPPQNLILPPEWIEKNAKFTY